MNRYLTKPAVAKRWWEVPAGLLSALLTAVSVQVWIEDSPMGEDIVIWTLAHVCVTGLMCLPLYRIALYHIRQHLARRIASRLAGRSEAVIPLAQLDRALGIKNSAAKISALLKRGFLQRLEIDGMNLLLDNVEPEAEPEPEPEPADDPDAVIREIRRLNDAIDDARVSERIDRIEAATAGILRTIRERPERSEEARRFMNYYLPATLKLLESYRLMEKQSYQGRNIQAARHSIEDVLDKLVAATEAQQDKLFGAEALDVETDIQVLETMLASDGLIERKI